MDHITPSTVTDERVLVHVKYLNDEAAERVNHDGGRGVTGASLRILIRTLSDEPQRIVATNSQRIHSTRASGKVYARWETSRGVVLTRTQRGLVVARRHLG